MKRTILMILSAATAAFMVLGIQKSLQTPQNDTTITTLPILSGIGGDFSLPATVAKNPEGTAKLSDFSDTVVLLNFGFTYCPDICPTTLARMRYITQTLDPTGEKITPIFVSFDPERDSISRLKEYLAFYSPHIIGMNANSEQLDFFKVHYKLIYNKFSVADGYEFAHTDFIYLIDHHGKVRAMLSLQTDLSVLKEKVALLLKETDTISP